MRSFPVFLRVDEKPPLVVGGGKLAGIKARLLLKRASLVEVAAEVLSPELSRLEAAGKIRRIEARPGIDQLRGRSLVISASEDDVEDVRISAMARALGVPVNVPDRPALCSFVLPSIVDRDMLTIAIGTEGAAPVLAQRIRAHLEQELHPRLGALAKLAGEFRARVSAAVPEGPQRRQVWDRIFAGRAAQAVLTNKEAHARRLIAKAIDDAAAGLPAEEPGRVILVGAGPGDPDLLTVKAIRALKAADIVFYDGLVGQAVLDHARREAELVPVAKAKGAHSVSQSEINRLMIAQARAGKIVVRLKGGDPFVFGRGGEELDALRAAGIEIDVVPGITAGLAAAASLQIPLTHRDHAHGVTFLTGHAAGGDAPDFSGLDLAALADGKHTLVLYMGVSTAGLVADALLKAGWRPSTPVIAVENASRDDERRIAADLALLAGDPGRLALKSPAVLIFGEVAGLQADGLVEHALEIAEGRRAHG